MSYEREPQANPGQLFQSLTPGAIGTWRAELEAFFANDWEELRSVIRQLEEQSWTVESAEQPLFETPESLLETVTELTLEAPDQAVDPLPTSPTKELPASPPVQDDRLEELARRIEERMQSDIPHRDSPGQNQA